MGTLTQTDLDNTITKIRARVGMPALNLAAANANPDPYLEAAETGYPNVSGSNKGIIWRFVVNVQSSCLTKDSVMTT